MEAALDELRDAAGSQHIELSELVVLGAQVKLDRLRAERDDVQGLRRRLADRIRARALPVSVDAANEVRRSGWAR